MSDRDSYRGRGRAAHHRRGGGRHSPKDENFGYGDGGRIRGSSRPVSKIFNHPPCDSNSEVGSCSLTVAMHDKACSGNEQSEYNLGTSNRLLSSTPSDRSRHSSNDKIGNQRLHLDFEEKLRVSGRIDKPECGNDNFSSRLKETKDSGKFEPFDICRSKPVTLVSLKPSLLAMNREIRNEKRGENRKILRPGMILLKNFLSISDQVKIVNKCREMGLGQGGFYQPGYRDGGKLHLKMMCLGKNWDPETSKYGELRAIDGAKPPIIPREFFQWVKEAIEESHGVIERNSNRSNAGDILPWMEPNICIVNFYSESGKLGLHQDKDESAESLKKGLPVVSFSIGDTAEFLYGDERDVSKAEKVELKSGDVVIFGGKSRLVFHGVSCILKDMAPKALLSETDLRPGRLNLTFRQE